MPDGSQLRGSSLFYTETKISFSSSFFIMLISSARPNINRKRSHLLNNLTISTSGDFMADTGCVFWVWSYKCMITTVSVHVSTISKHDLSWKGMILLFHNWSARKTPQKFRKIPNSESLARCYIVVNGWVCNPLLTQCWQCKNRELICNYHHDHNSLGGGEIWTIRPHRLDSVSI